MIHTAEMHLVSYSIALMSAPFTFPTSVKRLILILGLHHLRQSSWLFFFARSSLLP